MTGIIKCRRCGRGLRAEASIARGYGRTCDRKRRPAIDVIEAAAEVLHAPAAAIEKANDLIADGAIVPALDGRRAYHVVSSNGVDIYTTTPDVCTCPAGCNGRMCYHRVAALALAA